MRYAVLISYDGTHYGGWQKQNNAFTVQQAVEDACEKVFGVKLCVKASGRTDSGVHAAGQVCQFDVETTIPAEKISVALNRFLPDDIAALKTVEAPKVFDCNRAAKKKTYVYKIYLSECRNPLKDRYSVWVKMPLDMAKLQYIRGSFVGKHDFKAYCKSGSQVKTTVREVYFTDVKIIPSPLFCDVEIRVCGNGFLYNMVRTIVGTMIGFAAGSLSEDDVLRSLSCGDRDCVGRTMPAKGLTLESVDYGFNLFDNQ